MNKNDRGEYTGTAEILYKYEKSRIDAISKGNHLGRGVVARSLGV